MIQTNRTDTTLFSKTSQYMLYIYIYYDKFFTEILSHDGTNNYMNNNLDMKGQSISNTSQLSAITYVYTPTLRATKKTCQMYQVVEPRT